MTKLMLIQIADFLMGNIDNIPNEVLEKILANPDLQDQDLLSAGQTCQRWSSICEDILKKRKAAEIKETWTTTVRQFQLLNLDISKLQAEKLENIKASLVLLFLK